MADVSAHGDEEGTKEAKRIIEMRRLMEEGGVKCLVVMTSDTDPADRADRAVMRNMAETMRIRPLAQMPAKDKTPKGPVTSFKVGGHVWVGRPRPLGTHWTKTWYTPGKIAGKHVDFQYTQHENDSDEDEYLEEDDYVVDKVLSHRPNPAVPAGIEFEVKWKGYGKSHDSWVPPSSFVPRINKLWQAYLGQKGVDTSAKDLMAVNIQAEDDILSLTDPIVNACCTMGG